MIKVDLSAKERGDKVFSTLLGPTTITDSVPGKTYTTGHGHTYGVHGNRSGLWVHPELFESIEQCIEYFTQLRDENGRVTADEAIKAFRSGHKVKHKEWDDGHFIAMGDSEVNHRDLAFASLITDSTKKKNWEILG